MPLFIGLDASTQGLAATVIDTRPSVRGVVFEHSIDYDRDLPEYGTRNGVIRHSDPLEITSSPLMWADALDRMMAVIADSGLRLDELHAIAGSAQQHGSVYLNATAQDGWDRLDASRPLAEQLDGIFSRPESPVWMDGSTESQCRAIEEALGGAGAAARLTGSRIAPRFTAAQIRKFHETDPARYRTTDRIHLVSSYHASLLAGRHAAVDPGDAAGTNLLDIRRLQWSQDALDATAPGLLARLPVLEPSWYIVGPLAPYWQRRHGLPAMRVVSWSGDNPCSLVGAGIVGEGRLGVSLGTSDTIFAATTEPRTSAADGSHVFGSPAGGYMALVCFRNGSLAREHVRDAYGLDWNGFSEALRATPAGNHGALMLPWVEAEITPPVARAGIRRRDLDPADARANVRAVVEGQMMALANYAASLTDGPPTRITVTGGASANRDILRVLADVFEAEVLDAGSGAASLGAALRAFHADELADGRPIPWPTIMEIMNVPAGAGRTRPIEGHAATYRKLRRRYAAFERDERDR